MLTKLFKEDKGSTLVIVSLMATVLLAFTALVVDSGLLKVQVKRMEARTDAAALAGAQELPDAAAAINKGKEYAQKNGLNLLDTYVSVSEDTRSVGVKTYKEQPLSFARIFGREEAVLEARSRAVLSPVSKVWGAVPLGIDNRVLNYGELVSLKVAPGSDTENLLGSGNYGILALSGPGASNYENDLKNGFNSWLKIGTVVPLQSGNISGPTKDGVEYRLNKCAHTPKCTVESYERDCPMVLTVPVYEINSLQNGDKVKDIKIVGFAAFLLDSYTGNGNESYVKGYFIKKIEPGEYEESAPDFGMNVVHLTKW